MSGRKSAQGSSGESELWDPRHSLRAGRGAALSDSAAGTRCVSSRVRGHAAPSSGTGLATGFPGGRSQLPGSPLGARGSFPSPPTRNAPRRGLSGADVDHALRGRGRSSRVGRRLFQPRGGLLFRPPKAWQPRRPALAQPAILVPTTPTAARRLPACPRVHMLARSRGTVLPSKRARL